MTHTFEIMYQFINTSNLSDYKICDSGNNINFSEFNELHIKSKLIKHLSIKYVVEGREKYRVNDKNYEVKSGDLLIANAACFGEVLIDSPTAVKGLCLSVSTDVMQEVVNYQLNKSEIETGISDFFTTSKFMERLYSKGSNHLGNAIKHLASKIAANPEETYEFNREFYYHLGECVLKDHLVDYKQLQNIQAAKWITKKDLLRKVTFAKEIIESGEGQQLKINEIAQHIGLSEYHFMRLFKQVYGVSPYQFVLNLRLDRAFELLKRKELSIAEISHQTDFSDIQTFSKAFKRKFKMAPSLVLNLKY